MTGPGAWGERAANRALNATVKPSYRVETVRDPARLRSILPEWQLLLDQDADATPFAETDWILSLCEAGGAQPFVLVVWDGERMAGVAPFGRTASAGPLPAGRRLDLLGTPFNPRSVVLCGEDPPGVTGALLAELDRLRSAWSALRLREVPEDSAFVREIRTRAPERLYTHFLAGRGTACPYIEIASDYDTYIKSRPIKFRKDIRHTHNKCIIRGGATHVRKVDPPDSRDLVRTCFDIAGESWKGERRTGSFVHPLGRSFLERYFSSSESRAQRIFDFLYLEGKPMAYLISLCHHGRLYLYNTAYRTEVGGLNCGTVLFNQAVKYAFEAGLSRVDFLNGDSFYKSRWCNRSREHGELWLFPRTTRGALARLTVKAYDSLRQGRTGRLLRRYRDGAAAFPERVRQDDDEG